MPERHFRGHKITDQDVIRALADFDAVFPDSNSYENWLKNGSYRHALEHDGRQYPPKRILSEITGIVITELNGGDETNSVFQDLGFTIVPK